MSRRWLACLASLSVVFAVASSSLSKPPDLPKYQNITVTPATSADPHLLHAIGLFSHYPIQLIEVEGTVGPAGGEEVSEVPNPQKARSNSRCEPDAPQCPHLKSASNKPTDRQGLMLFDPVASRTVLDNLRMLEQASDAVEKAKRLAQDGKTGEAVECLEAARKFVTGSPCEARISEMLEQMVAGEQQPYQIELDVPGCGTCPFGKEDLEKIKQQCEAACAEALKCECKQATAKCEAGCCCGAMNQFGLCWLDQIMQALQKSDLHIEIHIKAVKAQKKVKVQQNKKKPAPKDAVLAPAPRTECFPPLPQAQVCPPGICKPLSVHMTAVPMMAVLDYLRSSTGCGLVIDFASLQRAGISPDMPVNVHAEGMPLQVVLDMMLRPFHLEGRVNAGVIVVGGEAGHVWHGHVGAEMKAEKVCEGKPCPKAQEMHARRAGKKMMVDGLMKACHLAITGGRHKKAAELACQAHALDPARVEADPMVIKLDLLNQVEVKVKTTEKSPCACPPRNPANPAGHLEEQEEPQDVNDTLVPHLPGVDPGVIKVLDQLLREKEMRRER